MSSTFYSYLAFIAPTSNAQLDTLKTYLQEFYSRPVFQAKEQPEISLSRQKITVTFKDGYRFYIHLSKQKHIQEEATEFLEEKHDYAEQSFDKQLLATCTQRFEIHGDDDYDIDYFNDSLYILEEIEKFTDIIIFYIN